MLEDHEALSIRFQDAYPSLMGHETFGNWRIESDRAQDSFLREVRAG